MKLKAEFVISVPRLELCPKDGSPEIALIGRSNVGKSSLLNAIVERKGLAKTSSTPGKTQMLNYFRINDKFYIVDMPGYGYAKAAKTDRRQWVKLTEDYFTSRQQLVATGILIDARHEALESDVSVVEWFAERQAPFFIVLTKIDKVRQQDLAKHEKMLKEYVFAAERIFRTSSETGRGIAELRGYIADRATGVSQLQG